MQLATIGVHVLQESRLFFDGGAMFGHVPKVVWGKLVETDELNRVECACNSLLVRTEGLNILTDPGMRSIIRSFY